MDKTFIIVYKPDYKRNVISFIVTVNGNHGASIGHGVDIGHGAGIGHGVGAGGGKHIHVLSS